MREVVAVGRRCHGFKADKIAALGRVNNCDGELGSVDYGDLLVLSLHPELGVAVSAAGKCGKASVEHHPFELLGISVLVSFMLAGGNELWIGYDLVLSCEVHGPLIARRIVQREV